MQVGSVQAKTASLIVQPAKKADRGYYDPADTNKDGVVSAAETMAYALTHPQFGAHKAVSSQKAQTSALHPATTYSQRATTNKAAQVQHGLLDLKA